jgi:uncharacterized damage-inducible protein DinB
MEAARALPDADFEKPAGVSHGSLQGTLAHILYADWIWFTRVVTLMEEPGQTREALERVWPQLQDKWVDWAEGASDAEMNRMVEFQSRLYGQVARPVWQILLHVVNHATLHRGQAMSILRQMGIAPPHIDFMNFYQESAAVGRA